MMRIRLSRIFKIIFLTAILLGTWKMILLTLPYTALQPGIDFLKTKTFIYHIIHWRWSFYIHVFTGIFALVAGLLQFSKYVLQVFPRVHRITGYVYVINVLLITGPAALLMSCYANGGWGARTSFILQSVAWLFCTGMALIKARNLKFETHGNWMLRSYALTLAALTLRSYAALLALAGSDMRPVDKYILIAWASWMPNLVIAEIMIKSGFIRKMQRTSNPKIGHAD